jgi:DNA-damage-inducible protein J
MTKTANINVRVYPDLKAEAEDVFAYHGLSLPEAITVFLKHACHVKGFPFPLKNERWSDPESLMALAESNHMVANPHLYKSYTVEELFAELNSDDGDDDEA